VIVEIGCGLWYHNFVELPNVGRFAGLKRGIEIFAALFCFVVLFAPFPAVSKDEGLKWESYKQGMKKAKAENRKIFLNFHADW
jgi:thiol:disulfide interchange protein